MTVGTKIVKNGIEIERTGKDIVMVSKDKSIAIVEKMDWHKAGFVQVRASDNGVSRYYRAYEGCSIKAAMDTAMEVVN